MLQTSRIHALPCALVLAIYSWGIGATGSKGLALRFPAAQSEAAEPALLNVVHNSAVEGNP